MKLLKCENFPGAYNRHSLGGTIIESFKNDFLKRLRSRLSDCGVAQLMRTPIEGPEIDAVEFEENWRFLKNIIIEYYFDCVV